MRVLMTAAIVLLAGALLQSVPSQTSHSGFAVAAKRPPAYSLIATRDCRAPGIAHSKLRLGAVVRFTAPHSVRGRTYRVTRRPGWLGEVDHAGRASVFEGGSGIAVRRLRRGGYYLAVSPNGVAALHVQRDWGPASWTGRWLDLTAPDAAMHGYSYAGFPTDAGTWRADFTGWRRPLGLREGRLPPLTALGLCRFGAPGVRLRVAFRVVRR